jgi:flagellar biosynthesis protein FliQ
VSDAQVLEIMSGALAVAARVSGPVLAVALVIGVIVSLLQTVTQIQEMTLTFVPKLMGAGLVMVVAGKWMLRELITWIQTLWALIPGL